MDPIQVPPIPEAQKTLIPRLAHDFRAALSYISFYPADSCFVAQSVQKLYQDFQKILFYVKPLMIHIEDEKIFLNDYPLSSLDALFRLFQDRNIQGVEIAKTVSVQELTDWLQIITSPHEENIGRFEKITHIRPLAESISISAPNTPKEPLVVALNTLEIFDTLTVRSHSNKTDGFYQNHQALLDFVEEFWQFFHRREKNMETPPEMNGLPEIFDQLFERLLDRMEKPLSDFKDVKA